MNPDVSPELDSVVMKAMSKNPANRYQTSAEFRSDLIKVLAGGKPSAPMLLDDDLDDDSLETVPQGVLGAGRRRRDDSRSDDYDDELPLYRRRSAKAALAVVLVLVLAVSLFAWAPWSSAPLVAVPKVTGLAANAAKANLEQAGFRVKELSEPSLEVAAGSATRTAPGNDVPTRKGSEVTLYVSSGPQRHPIPDLRGKSLKEATEALEKLGFTQIKPDKTDSTVAMKDKVVRTSPTTGSDTAVNTTVVVFVGTGPKEVTIPDLVGQTEDQARKTLEQMGLDMVAVQGDSERPAGQVVSSSPGAGETVEAGSVVQVTISRGNQFVVPDLRGKTPDQARAALKSAGWEDNTLTTTQRAVGLNSPLDGKVVSQSPAAGSRMKKDESVSVVIGRSSLIPG